MAEQHCSGGSGWSFVQRCTVSGRPALNTDRAVRAEGCSWAAAGREGWYGTGGVTSVPHHVTGRPSRHSGIDDVVCGAWPGQSRVGFSSVKCISEIAYLKPC